MEVRVTVEPQQGAAYKDLLVLAQTVEGAGLMDSFVPTTFWRRPQAARGALPRPFDCRDQPMPGSPWGRSLVKHGASDSERSSRQ